MKDALGDRMKSQYEERTRIKLPRRTPTIIRIDGKAFHTYTKGLERPFDQRFVDDMDQTAIYLCENIQGAKCAYVQSDEISILLTDYDKIGTDAWFDGNIQKMASVSASMATSMFNWMRIQEYFCGTHIKEHFTHEEEFNKDDDFDYQINVGSIINYFPVKKLAEFDSRVFTIPDKEEVVNYFIWRQQDCVRNSISTVAQSLYSHQELEGKNQNDKQEMIFQKGQNWNDIDTKLRRGRFINKEHFELDPSCYGDAIHRTRWISSAMPTITEDRNVILDLL